MTAAVLPLLLSPLCCRLDMHCGRRHCCRPSALVTTKKVPSPSPSLSSSSAAAAAAAAAAAVRRHCCRHHCRGQHLSAVAVAVVVIYCHRWR
jgi:hypothetical protein